MNKIASIEDIEKMEKTPLQLPNNTYQIFSQSAQQHPERIALKFIPNSTDRKCAVVYSYPDLLKKITQAANAFHHFGINKDEVVSLLLPNLPQTHVAMWGAQAVGIANPINALLEPAHIIGIMNAAQTKVLVAASSPDKAMNEKIVSIAEKVPSLEAILIVNLPQFLETIQQDFLPKQKIVDFDVYISQQVSDRLEQKYVPQSDDIACYLHTGGTTGSPKLAILTHANIIHAAWSVITMLAYEPDDICLACLPLFHVFGIIGCGLAVSMAGAEILLISPRGFRDENVIKNFWQLVSEFQVTVTLAVPTVYNLLSTIPLQSNDISCLKHVICGASSLPIQTLINFEKHTGKRILEGYGMTESAGIISVNTPYCDRKIGSVGPRIPYQTVKIIKTDEAGNFLRDCEPNEVGHIVVQGVNVFKGYKGVKQHFLPGNGFDTGDLGCQDKGGVIWIKGRSKDLIIRGGHNIDPQMIEEVLYQHSAILSAAAVGKPCNKAGELPVAYVCLREKNAISEKELLEFVTEKITERAAIPKNIYIIETMPMTLVGKIHKPTLRMDAIQRVFTEQLSLLKLQFDVNVTAHATHGQLAKVNIKQDLDSEIREKIHDLIKSYHVATEISFSSNS